MLYQTNRDQNNKTNLTPIPKVGVKAGFSYEGENGLTIGLFDIFEGKIEGYDGLLNPTPGSYHLVSLHAQFDFSKYIGGNGKRGLALFVHGDNLANKEIWLPAWGDGLVGTIPVNRGRTIYVGVQASR